MLNSDKSIAVAFRVDASQKIGTGHVMRCLTLANALREYGIKSYFLCRSHSGHMAEEIQKEGHNVFLLPLLDTKKNEIDDSNQYSSWLGSTLTKDSNQTINYLKEINPAWLIVDHFAINFFWEKRVKEEIALNIMVIDGLADRKHECDVLLDQTYSVQGEARWETLVPNKCKLFVGPKYALLRPEFIKARKNLRQREGIVSRIFISFGGIDELNATSRILAALDITVLLEKNISIDVVVGVKNPNRKDIIDKYSKEDNVNIYVNPNNMARLMSDADLAIGAGGTMMWERLLLKLPTLIISIANNQIHLAKSLHLINAAVYIGDISKISDSLIKASIDKLIKDEMKLIEIQSASGRLMSTNGMSVLTYLLESTK